MIEATQFFGPDFYVALGLNCNILCPVLNIGLICN